MSGTEVLPFHWQRIEAGSYLCVSLKLGPKAAVALRVRMTIRKANDGVWVWRVVRPMASDQLGSGIARTLRLSKQLAEVVASLHTENEGARVVRLLQAWQDDGRACVALDLIEEITGYRRSA